jgi:hypothetical protein
MGREMGRRQEPMACLVWITSWYNVNCHGGDRSGEDVGKPLRRRAHGPRGIGQADRVAEVEHGRAGGGPGNDEISGEEGETSSTADKEKTPSSALQGGTSCLAGKTATDWMAVRRLTAVR